MGMGPKSGRGAPRRRHETKSSQPVRRVLVVDRMILVDLGSFVFEHSRCEFSDPNPTQRGSFSTSHPLLGPLLPLSTRVWVSQHLEPKILREVGGTKKITLALTKWLSQ